MVRLLQHHYIVVSRCLVIPSLYSPMFRPIRNATCSNVFFLLVEQEKKRKHTGRYVSGDMSSYTACLPGT